MKRCKGLALGCTEKQGMQRIGSHLSHERCGALSSSHTVEILHYPIRDCGNRKINDKGGSSAKYMTGNAALLVFCDLDCLCQLHNHLRSS